jgi:hypothetical protein
MSKLSFSKKETDIPVASVGYFFNRNSLKENLPFNRLKIYPEYSLVQA